ncbi:protein of unknown function [Burkholderia multivorans]
MAADVSRYEWLSYAWNCANCRCALRRRTQPDGFVGKQLPTPAAAMPDLTRHAQAEQAPPAPVPSRGLIYFEFNEGDTESR